MCVSRKKVCLGRFLAVCWRKWLCKANLFRRHSLNLGKAWKIGSKYFRNTYAPSGKEVQNVTKNWMFCPFLAVFANLSRISFVRTPTMGLVEENSENVAHSMNSAWKWAISATPPIPRRAMPFLGGRCGMFRKIERFLSLSFCDKDKKLWMQS